MSTAELTDVAAPAQDKLDRKLIITAVIIAAGLSLAMLDATIVNVAVDQIAHRFRAPLSTVQWVITLYTLAVGLTVPVAGWAADRFGPKTAFLTGVALFLVGSAGSGLAVSPGMLIGARVVQGVGSGLIGPAGTTALTHAAGPSRLGRIMAFIGAPMLVAPVLGPALGGWLVDALSWRWIFFVNFPIGLAALIAGLRVIEGEPPRPECKLDLVGLPLLALGLSGIVFGVASVGNSTGAVAVFLPLVVGVVAMGLFLRRSLRLPYALIDPRLFTNRTFAAVAGTFFLSLVATFGGMLVLPLYLQTVRGASALHAGLLLMPAGLGGILAIPVAGLLADRYPIGRITPPGMVLLGIALAGLTQLGPHTSSTFLIVDLVVLGAGVGTMMVPMFTGTLGSLKKDQVARASTTLNILQQLGATIGTAGMAVVLTTQLRDRGLGRGGIGASSLKLVHEAQKASAAHAFGATFVYSLPLLAIALAFGLVFLPRRNSSVTAEAGV